MDAISWDAAHDPLLHVCVAAYASDMTLLDSVLLAQRLAWTENTVTGASLDHAMWFHAPFRADDWLLYVQEASATSGARGLARGLTTAATSASRYTSCKKG